MITITFTQEEIDALNEFLSNQFLPYDNPLVKLAADKISKHVTQHKYEPTRPVDRKIP